MSESKDSNETPEVQEVVQEETFSSDDAKTRVLRSPFCRIKMIVTPEKPLWEKAHKQALKEISKEVNIPGYRKGKAPKDILEKKYGEAIKQAEEKAIANLAWVAAQKKANVPLLNGNSQISYQVENRTSPENGDVVYQFETEPKIAKINTADFTLPEVKEDAIDAKKIDDTIRSIQMFYAGWNQIEDRPVKEGDFVVLDIDDIDSDPPVTAFSNARFEVAENKMARWMRELVLGKGKEESIEGVSEPDDDASEEEKKEFKQKKVKVTIKGIEEASLPTLDDAFAQKIGAENINDLKSKLEKLLARQAKEAKQKELRDSVAKQLMEKVAIEPPASVLEKEANYRMNELFRSPNFDMKWKQLSDEEKNSRKDEVKKQARDAIVLFYICRHIVTENNIQLSEEELNPNYDSLLEMMFADPSRLNFKNQSKEQKAIEFSKFMLAKAEDYLIGEIETQKREKSPSNS